MLTLHAPQPGFELAFAHRDHIEFHPGPAVDVCLGQVSISVWRHERCALNFFDGTDTFKDLDLVFFADLANSSEQAQQADNIVLVVLAFLNLWRSATADIPVK